MTLRMIPGAGMMLLSLFVLLAPATASAGGSVLWGEMTPLLAATPELEKVVQRSLDCDEVGDAELRLAGQYPLGGRRLGPYRFFCRVKGERGAASLTLTIRTSWRGYDKSGRPADVARAVRIDERAEGIELSKGSVSPDG